MRGELHLFHVSVRCKRRDGMGPFRRVLNGPGTYLLKAVAPGYLDWCLPQVPKALAGTRLATVVYVLSAWAGSKAPGHRFVPSSILHPPFPVFHLLSFFAFLGHHSSRHSALNSHSIAPRASCLINTVLLQPTVQPSVYPSVHTPKRVVSAARCSSAAEMRT